MSESVDERRSHLLGSQKAWLYGQEQERVHMAGWRAGKSFEGCLAGLLLSHYVPDNYGFIGRASGKDLHSTTQKTFFDEVCPSDLIVGKPKKIGQSGLEVVIRCDQRQFPGATSKIYFDYIIDRSQGKSHLAGGNWGWFLVDQLEEIQRADWMKLKGRLSRTVRGENGRRIPMKTHALGVGNQQGHDWIFEDFYESGDYILDPRGEPSVFWKKVHTELPRLAGEVASTSRLGIISRAEENAMSNGGFVPDSYYADQRRSNTPEFIARYIDGSFDDFTGKIYADYNINSVHNIEPFDIPAHWPWICVIDPGGSVPWGVAVGRMDEYGNKIIVNDAPTLYAPRVNPNHVGNWLKKNTPVDKCRYVIDYQNGPVTALLADDPFNIYCESAMKDQKVGLQGSINAFFINPARNLPPWYIATQPSHRIEKFKEKGSPQIFFFNTCKNAMKEHDNLIWDPVKKNVLKDGQHDHLSDSVRYLIAANPPAAEKPILDPYREFRKSDPVSAQHCDRVALELERHRKSQIAADFDIDPFSSPVGNTDVSFIGDFS